MLDSDRSPRRGPLRVVAWMILLPLVAWSNAGGEPAEYVLDLPAERLLAFQLPLHVSHPGPLLIEADWSGARVLSFRVDGPDGAGPLLRQSGPPPQKLELEVRPELAVGEAPWTLTIRALPSRDASHGTLRIELPRPTAEREPEQATTPAAPAPTPEEPWLLPRPVPSGAPPKLAALYEFAERFRERLTAGSDAPDAYGWQRPLLRYLAEERDRIAAGGQPPDEATRATLARIAEAIADVEALRVSRDPLIAGPPPEERLRRKAWEIVREDRLFPLERRLDALYVAVRGGHAPELRDEGWPAQLLSCLAACERHFAERARLGEEAAHRELVADQWDRILAAAEALERLAALSSPEEPPPSGGPLRSE